MRATLLILLALLAASPAAAHDWNGIAVDAKDQIYVVDAEDGQVWRIDSQGKVTVHVKGEESLKTCRHTHHLAIDKDGVLWLPSG